MENCGRVVIYNKTAFKISWMENQQEVAHTFDSSKGHSFFQLQLSNVSAIFTPNVSVNISQLDTF